jgi:hypothetical protein
VPTDQAGQTVLDLAPAYGEVLQVRGRRPEDGFDLFVTGLPVTGGLPLADPAVSAVVPSVALEGALTPGRAGEVTATITGDGFSLHLRGDGLDAIASTPGDSLTTTVIPVELSPVTATIGRPGHAIFQQEIAVIEARGTLAGSVVDTAQAGAPLAGAVVELRPAGADPDGPPVFVAVTDTSGAFAAGDLLPAGDYRLRARRFGSAEHEESVFLLHGANTVAIGLGPAPTGELSGTVTAAADGAPLAGTVTLRRADNDEVVLAVATDPATGAYAAGPVPYWDYRVVAASFGWRPAAVALSVAEPAPSLDFALERAPGELLVLTEGEPAALVADLDWLGFNLTLESAAVSDPAGWAPYDLVVYAAGLSGEPLASATLRDGLVAHAQQGGRLLVEGGAVADVALADPGHPAVAEQVLHAAAWHGDNGGDVAVAVDNHPLMLVPNIITGPIDVVFYDWAVSDRVTAATEAVAVGSWTAFPDQASVVAFDDPYTDGGETVVLHFAYEAAGEGRRALLENALVWLLAAEHDLTAADPTTGAPAALALVGNHPNPFNPSTVIAFELPASGPVDLAVYDLRGRRVLTLVRGELPAGRHEVAWRGRDATGRGVPSGIYLARLTAQGEQRVAKMMLLK